MLLVKDITPSFVEGWLAKLISSEGLGEDSYNKHLNVLRDFFKLANRDCPLLISPIAHIKAKRVPKGKNAYSQKNRYNISSYILKDKNEMHAHRKQKM